ncbi:MAG: DUF4276 family protein [Tannerella sp.]|jgi:hypothetical protein|nr:DUF4276 family protein [Tannerella sp.]
MNQTILHILCEGKTEKRFADKVLKPYLHPLSVKSVDIGGMHNYAQVKNNINALFKQYPDNDYEQHLFTSMFDLYALSNDFPAYKEAVQISDPYQQVEKLEAAFKEEIQSKQFLPYIQLHEFEALVFCGLEFLKADYPDKAKGIERLKEILEKYDGKPERINDSYDTAPSRRIIKEIGKQYNKPQSGTYVTAQVGIPALKERCPHFKKWMEKLEELGKQ